MEVSLQEKLPLMDGTNQPCTMARMGMSTAREGRRDMRVRFSIFEILKEQSHFQGMSRFMGCLNFPMKAEVGSYKSGGTASE